MRVSTDHPEQLFAVLRSDAAAMECLGAVQQFGPDGAYIAAGFVRNRYWDRRYADKTTTPDADVDVVYFNLTDISPSSEHAFELALSAAMPHQKWQVRNQARMHVRGGHNPFSDLDAALMHWSEMATAIGVRLSDNDALEHVAPFGLADLYDHILRITPIVREKDPSAFEQRLETKEWQKRWPDLSVIRD